MSSGLSDEQKMLHRIHLLDEGFICEAFAIRHPGSRSSGVIFIGRLRHDRVLENLLCDCNVLNISTPRKQKQPKETNWKQKFQKPQNENICLTYLNTENNGNFHFLSFCDMVCSIKKKGKRNVNFSTHCNQNCNMIGTFSHPDNKNL